MIAGGGKHDENCSGEEVGTITIVDNGEGCVEVTYQITVPGWMIDVTHLYVGDEEGIPTTDKGNPIPGQFPHNMDHEGGVLTYTETVCEVDPNYVVAAHAGVSYDPLDDFCGTLPETATISLSHPGTPSYFNVLVSNAREYNETYAAWCIDVGHSIASDGTEYTADVFCSYGGLVNFLSEGDNPHIDHPETFPIINWIINQGFVGTASTCGGNFTMGDVQRAIWEIIDATPNVTYGLGAWSQCRVDEITAAVEAAGTAASNYTPPNGRYSAVVFVPKDNAQVIVITFTYTGETSANETA